MVERVAPLVDSPEEGRQVQSPMLVGIQGQVAPSALEQGAASHRIPARMMVQRHRNLDQSLQKPALWLGREAPDILQDLVCFKEVGSVEKRDPMADVFGLHDTSVACALEDGRAAQSGQGLTCGPTSSGWPPA